MHTTTEQELFIRYGVATSEAMFDFPCQFFRLPDCVGVIPYRVQCHCAIVIGEPISPQNELAKLTQAFHDWCESSHLNIVYVIVSEKFAEWIMKQGLCKKLIEVCQEYVYDPCNETCLSSHRLKHRVQKARDHGITIHEYIPKDEAIEQALLELGAKWQKAMKGHQIYLGHLNFFDSYLGKRWFYAKDGEEITSMVMLSKIEASDGWLLKFLVNAPKAHSDTSELLITTIFDILRNENCHFLSKGPVPIENIREIVGFGSFASWISRTLYKTISRLYKFHTHTEYWLRYHPTSTPLYILVKNANSGIRELYALFKSFKFK